MNILSIVMLIPFYVSYLPVIYLFSQQAVDFFLVLFKMSLKNKVDITTNCQLMFASTLTILEILLCISRLI